MEATIERWIKRSKYLEDENKILKLKLVEMTRYTVFSKIKPAMILIEVKNE